VREKIVPTTLADFLTDQLEAQRSVYGIDPEKFHARHRHQYIRDNALAITHEVHEALNETSWKLWMEGEGIHTGRYLDELVDVFNFLLNLMLATGLSPQELAQVVEERFYAKKKVNLQRHTGS
jgi:hypothetical protein